MITIQQIDRNRITLRCHYAYRQRCHDIPGAVFDRDHKTWIAPIESLSYIQAAFSGEIYYKTPLWKLLGEKEPPGEVIKYLGPEPDLPELDLVPYRYQEDGIKFMIDRLNNEGFCLNGDGVGLGKTLQAIGTIKWFVENRGARKILIICKKSLKLQWADEIARIAGWEKAEMPIFVTGGTTKKRKQAAYTGIQEAPAGILITNYQDFLHWKDEIDRVNYDICVIDEAHCIKSREGKMNELVSDTCNGKRTILLTGTPVMSRPGDIWGVVRLATPKFFGTYEEFKKRYLKEEFNRKYFQWETVGAKNLDELQEKLSRFLIMRTAEDVAIDLPKLRKARHVSCPMDNTQEKMMAYVEYRRNTQEKRREELAEKGLTRETQEEIQKINDMSKMFIASLQYIASDPAVLREKFRDADLESEDARKINMQLLKLLPAGYKMSHKTEAVIDLVSELVDADEKVIIFCFYKTTVEMLFRHIKEIKGAGPVMYTGDTSNDERKRNIEAFRNDPDCRVLIANDAMAEGLNLQVSRNLIHFEQAENVSKRIQREGRIRRIGSAYSYVNITDVSTEGSFDEIKIAALRRQYRETRGTIGSAGSYKYRREDGSGKYKQGQRGACVVDMYGNQGTLF